MDSFDVIAMRAGPNTVKVANQSVTSASPKRTGPEMYPSGRRLLGS